MISLNRGVNLSHWLSQSERRGPERAAWTTRIDFARIREMGFDHVRLPVDEEQLWKPDGTRETEAWDLLESGLDWAEAVGLSVVCDLHVLRSHHFNQTSVPALYADPSELNRFCQLWRDLAGVLGKRSQDRVALEILNEAVARDDEDWNRVSSAAWRAMREAAPQHTIVLGSNWYCMCKTFPQLVVPDDPNLILTFHFYNPMFVTHHRAEWTPQGAWTGGISYPGKHWPEGVPEGLDAALAERMHAANQTRWGVEAMREEIQSPLAKASETGHKLYCGEFGVIRHAPLAIRKAWLTDAVGLFEENRIGWAMWDWKGAFGVVDAEGIPAGIHEAILP
ncbi:MAG: cellulase family glycosylhydrolase [Fibrobacterota bacterium]|nr:MAG: cellulase family glycosylhydrolase [Fibrobacterota bacterium]